MSEKYYQPSKKVSAAGLIILIIALIAVGSALAWIYLWINRTCTVVILNVFAAIGYGVAMGFLGRFIIKKCKLSNPAVVLLAVIVGVLGMTYVKWAIYDYYDWQMIVEAQDGYDYTDFLKEQKAFTRFEMYYDFGDEYGNFDEEYFEDNYEYLQNNAYTAIAAMCLSSSADINDYYSLEQQSEMKNYTLYEWYYYDVLLGDTIDECRENIAVAQTKNGYDYLKYMDINVNDFVEAYYGAYMYEAPSLIKVLTHPGSLWSDIKYINEEGRWSYSSSSSSSSYSSSTTSSEPVTGVMLWIVWICELLIIDLCSILIAYGQAKEIFIESDNDWAEVYDSNKLTFANMSGAQLKGMLETNPDSISALTPVDPVSLIGRPYVKLTISHSKNYSENYLNGYNMTYNAKNRGYVNTPAFKGLKITRKQAGVLLSMFGVQPSGAIANDPEFMNWRSAAVGSAAASYEANAANPADSYAQPQMDEVQPIAASFDSAMDPAVQTCGSCGTQVPAGKKFCPNCGAPFEKMD